MPIPGKLGRHPGKSPVLARLNILRYFDESKLTDPFPYVSPSSTFDGTSGVTSGLGMLGNDQYGDCVFAGYVHTRMRNAWLAGLQPPGNVSDASVWPTEDQVLTAYFTYEGSPQPANFTWSEENGYDNGADLGDALLWFTENEVGPLDKLVAFAGVPDAGEWYEQAIGAFGVYYDAILVSQEMMDEFSAGQPWSSVATDWVGGHCLEPRARVLTDKLEWVPAADLLPGQGLTAFDEERPGRWMSRHFRRGFVESTERLRLPCYELEFSDGTILVAAYDHKFLCRNLSGRYERELHWERVEDLDVDRVQVLRPLPPWSSDQSWEAGYVAAAFDGEGWLDTTPREGGRSQHRLGFDQRPNAMADTLRLCLKALGIEFSETVVGSGWGNKDLVRIKTRGRVDTMRLLGIARPQRLLAKVDPDLMGDLKLPRTERHVESQRGQLERKTFLGEREVVALSTSTRTYLSEGFASHNCPPACYRSPTVGRCDTWGQSQEFTWPNWRATREEGAVLIDSSIELSPDGYYLGVSVKDLVSDINTLKKEFNVQAKAGRRDYVLSTVNRLPSIGGLLKAAEAVAEDAAKLSAEASKDAADVAAEAAKGDLSGAVETAKTDVTELVEEAEADVKQVEQDLDPPSGVADPNNPVHVDEQGRPEGVPWG